MKFTDGNWFKRQGVHMLHPLEAQEHAITTNTLSLFAATAPVINRGSGINSSLLEIRLSAPFADVMRVQIFHYKGVQDRGPHFQAHNDPNSTVTIDAHEDEITFCSGRLTANVHKKQPWNVDFSYDGCPLTRSSSRNTAYITVDAPDDKKTYIREQLDLAVGESVYGFGERFTSFVKNGQVVETWNHDGGAGSEQAYKSIPFYITNKGYGVFVNHPEQVSFEVASEHVKKVQF